MLSYPAQIHKDEDGLWLSFIDLNNSGTQGDTMEELIDNAEDLLKTYLEVLLEEGKPFPVPTGLKGENIIHINVYLNVKCAA